MVTSSQDPRAEDFRQSGAHRLYVEGGPDSFDQAIISAFFRKHQINIPIKGFGPAYNLKNAAQAFHPHHPKYYYLIDRDYHDDGIVNESWKNFPDPSFCNLLIWRRRELENYFLIPDYLAKSAHLDCSKRKLKESILKTASKRIYLDVANMVISEIKGEMSSQWIKLFDGTTGFETRKKALKKLRSMNEYASKKERVAAQLNANSIEKRFVHYEKILLDGTQAPEFGRGGWLEMVRGSRVLPTVINECFKIKDARGEALQGDARMIEVAKALVRFPLEDQPEDFQELHRLISEIMES